jgi:prevent-host-death family protein
MNWKITAAKQRLSQVIRAAAKVPQIIYSRNQPVAAVISMETFALFEVWRREREQVQPLAEAFGDLRVLCAEEDYEFPETVRQDRLNPFADRPTNEG